MTGSKLGQENGYKGSEVNVMNIKTVDPFQDFSGGIGIGSHRPQGSLQAAHEHASRDAMSAHICDDQSMGPITELEKVKIIAADDLGGRLKAANSTPLMLGIRCGNKAR